MGESACLLRSFSHPSAASRESKEGNPIPALGESISFGRFMTEPLAWEKWSAFSRDRYQEELEKFSKPGSVAQKKAYFEAHYKRKAAQKAAAQLGEELNTTPPTIQVETNESSCIGSCVELELLRPSDQVTEMSEQQIVSPTDADVHHDSIMVETLADKVEEVLEQNNSMENATSIENANHSENVEDRGKMTVDGDAKTLASPAAEKDVRSSGGSLKRLRNYSTKLLTRSRSPKSQPSPAKQATTSSQQCANMANAIPKSKKQVGNIVEKLRMKSVHASMHFNPCSKEIGKISSDHPQTGRKRAYMNSLVASIETSIPQKIFNRVTASVNGSLKQPLIKPPLENKRCLRSSNATGIERKVRPPLICSPFSFRSEERVAKRREFFEKLEDKAKSKEMEQKQLQARLQEKKKNDTTKLHQSRIFEAKANQDSDHRPKSPADRIKKANQNYNQGPKLPAGHIKKIPVTRPLSPKLGRKPGNSSAAKNICSPPPKRPSVTSDDSKIVTRKRYGGTAQSVTSLGKKTSGCENVSPNIQS